MSGHHAIVGLVPFYGAWLAVSFGMIEGLRRWARRREREQ